MVSVKPVRVSGIPFFLLSSKLVPSSLKAMLQISAILISVTSFWETASSSLSKFCLVNEMKTGLSSSGGETNT